MYYITRSNSMEIATSNTHPRKICVRYAWCKFLYSDRIYIESIIITLNATSVCWWKPQKKKLRNTDKLWWKHYDIYHWTARCIYIGIYMRKRSSFYKGANIYNHFYWNYIRISKFCTGKENVNCAQSVRSNNNKTVDIKRHHFP